MKLVEPCVFLLGKPAVQYDGVRDWLDDIGAYDYQIPDATDAALLVMLAGKRCYNSFVPGLNPNVTRTRSDVAEFIENILKSRHGSVLEHVSYTFGIEHVSRVFTAELERHRAGVAISEGSLRYIRFTDIPFWMPLSIRDADDDSPDLRAAKAATRRLFEVAFADMEQIYRELENVWQMDTLKEFKEKKKLTSLFRRIIGMGVATGLVWTVNLRALRHILTVRVAPEAEEEIAHVCGLMLAVMQQKEPELFGDFQADAEGVMRPAYVKV